jgi:DNA-binding transcriptional LysR family regulator
MNIELTHTRYFVAVTEELHFGKAANRLGISQPPISQQILALEREIGARLFERSNRRVELTNARKLFLKEASEFLERVDSAAALAERIHKGQLGELRIGFSTVRKLAFAIRARYANLWLPRPDEPSC